MKCKLWLKCFEKERCKYPPGLYRWEQELQFSECPGVFDSSQSQPGSGHLRKISLKWLTDVVNCQWRQRWSDIFIKRDSLRLTWSLSCSSAGWPKPLLACVFIIVAELWLIDLLIRVGPKITLLLLVVPELQKRANRANQLVLFFLAGANFWEKHAKNC